jgi:hypothetical protein
VARTRPIPELSFKLFSVRSQIRDSGRSYYQIVFSNPHGGTAALGCLARQSPAARRNVVPGVPTRIALLMFLFVAPALFASDCIPVHEAGQHVGENKCVTGKVLRVKVGTRGVHFLDFCEDQMACPFTVVVFSHNLKDVGDVRRLAGRTIEVHGPVKLYDGRAEIILNRISQITGGAALIPPLPKNYDVENRGHFNAGHVRPAKKPAKTKAKPNTTATYGNDVEGADPEN